MAWNHVSPSQIENFIKCKRLWFFKSILKLQETQKGHQSLGEAFHLIMEKKPKGLTYNHADVAASPDDWAKAELMAAQALPLLPVETAWTPVFKREHGIRLDTFDGGPTMIGYIDLGIPSGVGWPAFMFPAHEAIVADYKTLSNFRYMKTPQELADSVQMMTYAKWAIEPYPMGLHGQNDPEPTHVRLLHMYARTKPPFTRASIRHESAIVTPSEINTHWNKTLDIVRDMQQTSTCGNADDVEAGGALNGHCEAYGGCHFRDKCGIAKASGIKSLFQITKKPESTETQDMSGSAILDKIKAARAAQQNSNGVGSTTPAANTSASPGTADKPAEANQQAGTVSNSPSGAIGAASSPTSGIQTAPSNLTPNVSPVASKGPFSGLMAKIQGLGKGQPQLSGAAATAFQKETGAPAVPSGDLAKTVVSTLGELMKLASGVVPPDAPARTQAVITKPGDTVVDPIKVMEPEGDSLDDQSTGGSDDGNSEVSDSSVDASTAVSSGGSDSGVPASEPVKRRGRPTNAELEARRAEEQKAFEARVEAEVQKRLKGGTDPVADLDQTTSVLTEEITKLQAEIEDLSSQLETSNTTTRKLLEENERLVKTTQSQRAEGEYQAKAQSEGFTLYVDCFPTKGEAPTDFFEWIGPICAAVAEQNNVGDWRQINYTAKGLLANAIRATVKEEGLPKAMRINSYSGGADIALEILTPLAKRVIQKL